MFKWLDNLFRKEKTIQETAQELVDLKIEIDKKKQHIKSLPGNVQRYINQGVKYGFRITEEDAYKMAAKDEMEKHYLTEEQRLDKITQKHFGHNYYELKNEFDKLNKVMVLEFGRNVMREKVVKEYVSTQYKKLRHELVEEGYLDKDDFYSGLVELRKTINGAEVEFMKNSDVPPLFQLVEQHFWRSDEYSILVGEDWEGLSDYPKLTKEQALKQINDMIDSIK